MNKLYTVLIAEDEDIIRNGLISSIPWNQMGFEPIATRNGKVAFEFFQSQKIDMIITDIKMPFMTGIDLIEQVRKVSSIPIIILSGYDDFKYAQQALRLGANEYLLKPLIMDDFLPLLKTFHEQLDETSTSVTEKTSSSISLDEFITKLSSSTDYNDMLPYLNHYTNFTFCIIRLNNLQHYLLNNDYLEMINMDHQLFSIFENLIQQNQILNMKYQLGERILLISGIDIISIRNILDTIGDLCSNSTNEITCHSLTSNIYDNVDKIHTAYNELMELRNSHFIDHSNSITTYEFMKQQKSDPQANSYFSVDTTKFYDLLLRNNKIEIIDWFSSLQQEIITTHNPTLIQSQMISSKLYHLLMVFLDEKCNIPSQNYLSPETSYSTLLKQTSLNTMFLTLCATALDVSNIVTFSTKPIYSDSFQSALSYIDAHYCDYDISLEHVAKKVNMGRCYLSAMFTQNLSKTFIEYLTELRMEKALDLMKNSTKMIYEIADSIGYQNSTYFSTVFKKYYGKSPKEFKTK